MGGWGSGRNGKNLGRSKERTGPLQAGRGETGQAAAGRGCGQEWEAKEWGEEHEASHAVLGKAEQRLPAVFTQLTHSHHLTSHQAQACVKDRKLLHSPDLRLRDASWRWLRTQ